jgi:hypothetical protein
LGGWLLPRIEQVSTTQSLPQARRRKVAREILTCLKRSVVL